MTQSIDKQHDPSGRSVIVGLGATGLSVARHLIARGEQVVVLDTRQAPPALAQLRKELPQVPVIHGDLDEKILLNAARIIVSPGVAMSEPALLSAVDNGVEVIGDIELFAREALAPIAAITGSNGKSTVTAMLGAMARADQRAVQLGGNFGKPALELLEDEATELYVLELSSFQLETTWSLSSDIAAILNISADHLDRYTDLAQYIAAKLRILNGAKTAVINLDDVHLKALPFEGDRLLGFSVRGDALADACISLHAGERWLSVHGQRILALAELPMVGRHNLANALAALLMADTLGISSTAMCDALKNFKGLAHRCELVAEIDGVRYINDSKGTNVGSSVAAIEGLGNRNNLVLIAGGLGKGQDFSPLRLPITQHVHTLVLLGQDAKYIDQIAPSSVRRLYADDMQQAVEMAHDAVSAGDIVLLSPACASMDMFDNYTVRGDVFSAAVHRLEAS